MFLPHPHQNTSPKYNEHANAQVSYGCTTQPAPVMSAGAVADSATPRTHSSALMATSPTSPASSLASGKLFSFCIRLLSVFRVLRATSAMTCDPTDNGPRAYVCYVSLVQPPLPPGTQSCITSTRAGRSAETEAFWIL